MLRVTGGSGNMSIAFAVARRLLQSVLVVVAVSVVVFIVTHLVGDPVRLMLPLNASHAQYLAIRHELGLDRPVYAQFGSYVRSLVKGDLGESLWQHQPAFSIALRAVWPTVVLGGLALGLGAILGIVVGSVAAIKAGTILDRAISMLSMAGVSIASFWLSLMLIWLFAVRLHWLPTSGYSVRGLVLPAAAAAAYPFGHVTQIARATMIDELSRPYVVAARSKGLSTAETVIFHATRNALIPIVTVTGFEFGRIMAGALVVIETIFGWPGIGNLTYQALSRHDYPLIQACVFLIAVFVVGINLVVDLVYSIIDPRTSSSS
jgi:peptide/nickel transport system permease protein